ncbi:MAG: cyclase, partial [Mycobacterium sp.]
MAVKASREFVIDAPQEVIMEALADVSNLTSWSSLH